MWLQLARATTADNGQAVTDADLRQMVATFQGDAPVVIEAHTDAFRGKAPRLGAVKELRLAHRYDQAQGADVLSLDGRVELHAALKAAYDQGLYTQWSIGAPKRKSDGERYLHHVQFLGATPPAIKGLQALTDLGIALSADEAMEAFQFSVPAPPTAEPAPTPADPPPMPDPKKDQPDLQPDLQAQLDAANQTIKDLQAKLGAKPSDKGDLGLSDDHPAMKRLAALEAAGRTAKLGQLRQACEGRVPEGSRDLLLALAGTLPMGADDALTLSDDDGTERTVAPLDALIEAVRNIPQPVQPGVLALGDLPDDEGKDDAASTLKMATSL